MTTFVLILFLQLPNQLSASVRIGFDNDAACVAAARTISTEMKAHNPGADIIWSCVRQG